MVVCMVLRWFRPVGLLPTGSSNFTLSPGGGKGGSGQRGPARLLLGSAATWLPHSPSCLALPACLPGYLLLLTVVRDVQALGLDLGRHAEQADLLEPEEEEPHHDCRAGRGGGGGGDD